MIPVANVSEFYAKVREFYVYMVSRHTVHLQVLERSLLLLKLIVNMLALYINAIEVVLLYLRPLVTWGKLKNNVLIFKVMTHTVNGRNGQIRYTCIAITKDQPLLYM